MIAVPTRPRRLAGIDIRTLTCRPLIADFNSGSSLKELRSERCIVQLDKGVYRTKRLSSSSIDRVIQYLQGLRGVIDSYDVDACTAVATSAVRDAVNRDEFLRHMKQETGLEVEIITGGEEARRTVLGIRSGLLADVTDILALDIGGGSTELILDRPGQAHIARSIDIVGLCACVSGSCNTTRRLMTRYATHRSGWCKR